MIINHTYDILYGEVYIYIYIYIYIFETYMPYIYKLYDNYISVLICLVEHYSI